MGIVKGSFSSPDFCLGLSEEPMEHNCIQFELDPSTSEFGIPLCYGQGTSSDAQKVA